MTVVVAKRNDVDMVEDDHCTPSSITSLSSYEITTRISSIRHHRLEFTNWATTYSCRPCSTFKPNSVYEVRLIVELARRERRELRVRGSGHSPSDLVCTNDWVLDLSSFDRVLEIDTENNTFTAQGGIKLTALHPILASKGLAISSLGSISDQQLAGCLSTATHGSGVTFQNLSSRIEEIELVLPLPGSPIVKVTESSDEALFNSARCGLGVIGIILSIKMKVEPKFNLEEELTTVTFADFVQHWKMIAESAEHVRCWWFPQVGQVKISKLNRTTKRPTPSPSPLKSFLIDTIIGKYYHAIVLSISRYFPDILPYHAHTMWHLVHRPCPLRIADLLRPVWPKIKLISPNLSTSLTCDSTDSFERETKSMSTNDKSFISMKDKSEIDCNESSQPISLTKPIYRIANSVEIFNYDCSFEQYTYEGAVPYSLTSQTLLDLERFYITELNTRHGLRSHFPIEIRYTEKDDIYLSPTYEQRSTYIGAIQYRPFNLPVPYKKLFSKFETILLNNKGRPHWAKSHTLGTRQLERLYPKFNVFLETRQRIDPDGILLNAYTKRHLLGRVGEQVDFKTFKKSGR